MGLHGDFLRKSALPDSDAVPSSLLLASDAVMAVSSAEATYKS